MKVVGVGCAPGLLTDEARRVLAGARRVYGSRRAIGIAREALPRSCEVHEIRDYSSLDLPDDAILLSTGDPMLAGLGYLSGEVIPGISSLQIAAARLHLPLSRIAVVVAHGRGHEKGMQETVEEIRRGKIVFLLADPKFDCAELWGRLSGISPPLQVALCENLGYPDERIVTVPVANPPAITSDLYSLVIGHF